MKNCAVILTGILVLLVNYALYMQQVYSNLFALCITIVTLVLVHWMTRKKKS